MKRISKLLIITILCTVCLVLIACGKTDSIYFETEPRTTYVQGQDFTLENSTILAMSGDKTSPIDPSEVTVSGYNKDQLGEQNVTVAYEEHTVTLKVTVIPRIAAEGITREYFVGDSFDKTKGRLRIADDQANVKSVNLSESAVTVEGFDSSSAGTKNITVKYGDYTGTFSVNVFDAEMIELTSRPKKTTYYSHDTEFSTTGAFFTVTANNGSLTRMIEVTPDMVVRGSFLPSAATIEHMDTPLKQTVKFTYLGKTFDFNISIRFSGVSLVLLRNEELKDVTPETATNEQNENALDALRRYADLTPSEQNLIDDGVIQKLLEVGISYGAKLFAEELASYSDTFRIYGVKDSETGRINAKITITASSYDAVKADLERLLDDENALLSLADTLYEIKEEFYSTKIGDSYVDTILSTVFATSDVDEITKAFNLLIKLHETLLPIPADWTKETLADYGKVIDYAVDTINSSDYDAFEGPASDATLYAILSSWRGEANDYFDIIYAYYYHYDKASLIDKLWEKIHMPLPLHELYKMHNFAMQEALEIGMADDTSIFMYYYNQANRIANEIKESGNTLHINLYNFFNFDRLINAYLYFGTEEIQDKQMNGIAYVYHVSSLLGNTSYEILLDDFIEIFRISMQEGFSFEDERVKELAIEILESYVSFTPAEKFAFLSALHCDYRITTSTELVLKHSVGEDGVLSCYSYFTYLIYSSFKELLTEDAYDIFARLMEASEMHALRYHNQQIYLGFTDVNGGVHLGFVDTMKAIIEDASALSEDDKALFKNLLAQMTEIYNETLTPPTITLTDRETELFGELKGTIENFYYFYNIAISDDIDSEDRFKYYIIAFSAYERSKTLITEIRALNSENAIYTLLYSENEFSIVTSQATGVINSTYDSMVDGMGGIIYLTMLRDKVDTHNVCTIYLTYKVSSFLDLAYDVLLAEYNGIIDASYADELFALMEEYVKLNDNQIFTLRLLGAMDYYYSALENCFGQASYDDATKNVISLLVATERAYADCLVTDDRTIFTEAFNALKNAYNSLSDKSAFDADFKILYAFYAAKAIIPF